MRLMRRTAFVLCLIVFFSYEAYALFVRESGVTAHEPRPRELHLTREVNVNTPLSQTFVMHAEGFQGVELFARPSDQPPSGPLEVVVMQETEAGWVFLSRSQIDVESIDLAGSVVVTTPRVDHSAGTAFRVDVTMPQAAPGHGLRFQAGGPTYVQGVMTIGGRQEWGDLKFRTRASRATVLRNLQHVRQTWPAPFRSDLFWIFALLVINWALATVVYYLAFAPEAPANGSALTTADQPRV
jgi:hypothetical protein